MNDEERDRIVSILKGELAFLIADLNDMYNLDAKLDELVEQFPSVERVEKIEHFIKWTKIFTWITFIISIFVGMSYVFWIFFGINGVIFYAIFYSFVLLLLYWGIKD